MRGFRNVLLALAYLATCCYFAHLAGPTNLKDLGAVLTGIGLSMTGIIAGRAANKYAEKKGEPPCGSTS